MGPRSKPLAPNPSIGWTALIAGRMPGLAAQRVWINRKLRQTGAVLVRDGVYALPDTSEARTALEDARRELKRRRGSALPCVLTWLDPGDETALHALYARARDRKRRKTLAHMERLERVLQGSTRVGVSARRTAGARLARLRKHLENTPGFHGLATPVPGRQQPAELARISAESGGMSPFLSRVWVTRRGVLVDRIASAWLIQRFVDPVARFRFVGKEESPAAGEVRFDMPEAEFTHKGDRCTFETLVARFRPQDAALGQLAEIIHDLDIRDGKFGRPEAAGVGLIISGLALIEPGDNARLAYGRSLFDCLYGALRPRPTPQPPKGLLP